jgi:hypothetical protein
MAEMVSLKIAVWLAAAEINSLWMEAVRGDECQECHHCPKCCHACDALQHLRSQFDLDDAVRRYVGTGLPWQDEDGLIRWKDLTRRIWDPPCSDA